MVDILKAGREIKYISNKVDNMYFRLGRDEKGGLKAWMKLSNGKEVEIEYSNKPLHEALADGEVITKKEYDEAR